MWLVEKQKKEYRSKISEINWESSKGAEKVETSTRKQKNMFADLSSEKLELPQQSEFFKIKLQFAKNTLKIAYKAENMQLELQESNWKLSKKLKKHKIFGTIVKS